MNRATILDLLRRVAGFGSLTALASIAPIILLPLIARVGGPEGWVAILGAQAVGGAASVIILWGWTVTGQAEVAIAPLDARDEIYRASLPSRTRISLAVIPVGLAVVYLLGTTHAARITAGLMFMATASGGFSMSWFATGAGVATWIAWFEVLPKLVCTGLAAVAVLLTGQLWTYPALLLVGTGLGLTAFHLSHFGECWPSGEVPRVFRPISNWPAAALSVTGAVYSSSPVPIAAALAPTGAAALASADKLYRLALLAITALANALQSWVLESTGRALRWRVMVALLMHATYGFVGAIVLASASAAISRTLFGASVMATPQLSIVYAIAFFAVNVSTPLIRNVLIPMGGVRIVLVATLVSLAVGLPISIFLAQPAGAVGVAAGLAASEVLMAALVVLASANREERTR